MTNNLMNYDVLVDSICPFNCRELIELWVSVSRESRMKNSIHKKIIYYNWPELLDFPINPGSKYGMINKNSILFYLGTWVKYFLERNKHKE